MIKIINLSYKYNGNLVLKDINLTISNKCKVAIMGDNGAGKSTLLMHIVGCLKPFSGDVLYNNKSIYEDLALVRREVGIVFQEPEVQLFMPTVWENVAFGMPDRPRKKEEARETSLSYLKQVDLAYAVDKPSHQLSGGEKKRAVIASVLAQKPKLLVLDEPTTALDEGSKEQFVEIIKNIDVPFIMSSHDKKLCFEVADRTIYIKKGEIVSEEQDFL